MSAKIIPFTGITKLDMPADRVLEAASGQLEGVVVIGFDHAGELYATSSYADGGTVLWLLEQCKTQLLRAVE
mgnify:CR=1 FL=1